MWRVILEGSPESVEFVAEYFQLPFAKIERSGVHFELIADQFEELEDVGAVRQRTGMVLATLNGLARLSIPNFEPVSAGSIPNTSRAGISAQLKIRVRAPRLPLDHDGSGPPVWLTKDLIAGVSSIQRLPRLCRFSVDPSLIGTISSNSMN
jgi:hypothetical protein